MVMEKTEGGGRQQGVESLGWNQDFEAQSFISFLPVQPAGKTFLCNLSLKVFAL